MRHLRTAQRCPGRKAAVHFQPQPVSLYKGSGLRNPALGGRSPLDNPRPLACRRLRGSSLCVSFISTPCTGRTVRTGWSGRCCAGSLFQFRGTYGSTVFNQGGISILEDRPCKGHLDLARDDSSTEEPLCGLNRGPDKSFWESCPMERIRISES